MTYGCFSEEKKMKLRNKITNEICDAKAREDGIYLKINWGDHGEKWHKYGLRCLGDNWEYCVEPKEPLIKDEKIRKAVRAWAEVGELEHFTVVNEHFNCCKILGRKDNRMSKIEFLTTIPNTTHRIYTIAELCGEEEE